MNNQKDLQEMQVLFSVYLFMGLCSINANNLSDIGIYPA